MSNLEPSRYPAAIRHLSLQPTVCAESLSLVSYLWHKDGATVLYDLDKARMHANILDGNWEGTR